MLNLNAKNGFKELVAKQKMKNYKSILGHQEYNKRVGDNHTKVAEIRREVQVDTIGQVNDAEIIVDVGGCSKRTYRGKKVLFLCPDEQPGDAKN